MCSGAQSSRTLFPVSFSLFFFFFFFFFCPTCNFSLLLFLFLKIFSASCFSYLQWGGLFFHAKCMIFVCQRDVFPFCNFWCSSSFFLESFMKKKLNVINPLQANFKWLALAFRYWSIAADQQNVIRCSGKVEHLFWKMTKKRNAYSSQNKKKE